MYFQPVSSLVCLRDSQSYEEIRTVNGITYATFKETCYALGLLENDKEWADCLEEASVTGSGAQLRHLFCTLLMHCEIVDPARLWQSKWRCLSDDILYVQRKIMNYPQLQLSDTQIQTYALLDIQRLLAKAGKSLDDYSGLKIPGNVVLPGTENRLILEELNCNREVERVTYLHLLSRMNKEQRMIHDKVLESITQNEGKLFFVSGHGGTGKTYLWRSLISKIRSEGKIVLSVATSGIAALLLPGGRTAHSRFQIPLILNDTLTCGIKKGTQLANLMLQTSLIIWDEAPMTDKRCFEAVDRTLRDILSNRPGSADRTFGGITTILGGDFRQILPVITNGDRHDTIGACIKSSYLWESCHVLELCENMRLQSDTLSIEEKKQVSEFGKWILDIGNGVGIDSTDEKWISMPSQYMISGGTRGLEDITDLIELTLPSESPDFEFLQFS